VDKNKNPNATWNTIALLQVDDRGLVSRFTAIEHAGVSFDGADSCKIVHALPNDDPEQVYFAESACDFADIDVSLQALRWSTDHMKESSFDSGLSTQYLFVFTADELFEFQTKQMDFVVLLNNNASRVSVRGVQVASNIRIIADAGAVVCASEGAAAKNVSTVLSPRLRQHLIDWCLGDSQLSPSIRQFGRQLQY
jgi:hypothetical protein